MGYQKHSGTRDIAAGSWTTINKVPSISKAHGLYITQFVVKSGRHSGGILRVRFNRNGTDGTGDQTFLLPDGGEPFHVAHDHSVSRFSGKMWMQVQPERPLTLGYRIAKSIRL